MKGVHHVCTAVLQMVGILGLLLMSKLVSAPANDAVQQSCHLDDVSTKRQLEKCLKKGDRFINRYLSNVRRGSRRFDRCAAFYEFSDCVEPMTSACPNIQAVVGVDWGVVSDKFHCACNGSQGCVEGLDCFEGQYGGVLARRCDAYYKFNVHQKTRERCQFITENVNCKQTLLESGCGEVMSSEFAFRMSKLSSLKAIRSVGCQLSSVNTYTGFRYDDDCPADFVHRLEECQTSQIKTGQRLQFHPSNDLVVQGRQKDLKIACSQYEVYTECIEETRRDCPVGMALYLEHESRLRMYVMKLGYICGAVQQNYSSNIQCYTEVLDNRNLTQCDYIYVALQPILQRVTAYEFYCKPEEKESSQLKNHLDRLRDCYKDVFTAACSDSGGSAMSGLIRRVFDDPFYLRYKYRPDCGLHAVTLKPTSSDRTGRDRQVGAARPTGAAHTTSITLLRLTSTTFGLILTSVLR